VNPPGAATFQVRVAASIDDAEESATGVMDLTSTDLELVFDKSNQTVGMRFRAVTVPRGATIISADVQFQVDENDSPATSLGIRGEAADNAATFTTATRNISTRNRTISAVSWTPPAWPSRNVAGPDQRTPNLAALVQEIVNRPGWQSGNALVLIVTGTGKRVAEAFDGVPAAAPLLRVDYIAGEGPPPNTLPVVTITQPASGSSFVQGTSISFTGTASDAENGNLAARLVWSSNVNGPFGSGGAVSTSSLSAGTHTITASVTDNDGGSSSASISITVSAGPPPNALPVVTITQPASGSSFVQGTSISFTGTALDVESGNLTASLVWSSSMNGTLGSGGSVSTSSLSAGTHTITATVTDNDGGSASASISITVNAPGAATAQVRVAASTDDAEESATGVMDLTSTDLEMVFDNGSNQTVGMRFTAVTVPRGAAITSAYVQFQVDETDGPAATSLSIWGEAVDNAATFTTATRNISTRNRTSAAVSWTPPTWPTADIAGPNQRTPNLAALVQEIVNRPGWQSGNALVLIITGTGERVAEAFDGVPAAAPLLRVDYNVGGGSAPVSDPTASAVTVRNGRQ
jgi:hypothetical protein